MTIMDRAIRRARNSGIHLTKQDVAQAKGMLLRGDRQHDIAAWFGVNGGRISEIATGRAFAWITPEDPGQLPPPGPYLSGKAASEAVRALADARAALNAAEMRILSR